MKATAEHTELDGCRREILFEAPADEVSKALDGLARELGGTVNIKGFRQGKAPVSVVRQRYQKELEGELLRKHLPEWLKQEIEGKGIAMCGEPEIVDLDIQPKGPMRVRVRYEVFPEVTLNEYKGIELTDSTEEVTDQDVEQELESLRDKAANFVPVEDREIASGDYAMCDIVITRDGKAEKRDNVLVAAGAEGNAPLMNEKILSLKRGEEVEFEMPTEGEEGRAPRPATYKVKLKEVKRKELAPLDDEFAKDVGDFENLEALKTEIREGLKTMRADERYRAFKEQLQRALLERHAIDVPATLVEEETQRVLGNLIHELSAHGNKAQISRIDWDALKKEQRKRSADALRFSLLLKEIADAEKIEVSDEDADLEIVRMAAARNVSPDKIRSNLNKDNNMDGLKADLLERKVVDFLVGNGKILRRENKK